MGFHTAWMFVRAITLYTLITCTRCETVADCEQPDTTCTGDACYDYDKHDIMEDYIEEIKEDPAATTKTELEEMTEEDLKQIHRSIGDNTNDINTIVEQIGNKETTVSEYSEMERNEYTEARKEYEFPKLTMINPGNVGDVLAVELEDGKMYRRITKSCLPPVFEIPNFLSDEECDLIINCAKTNGLNVSNLFGADVNEEFEDDLDLSDISRVSEQTWLREESVGFEFWNKLHRRLSRLTELPLGMIERGEPMQVVTYTAGGHYHAHIDTTEGDDELPCCFQTHCADKELTPEWSECCRLCRFMTVLYYLNEPEEGGETAFPLAGMSEKLVEEKFINIDEQDWYNLSYYCHNSSLRVKPKRGTAVMWYNHFIDEQTGYLGKSDRQSNHGGCDLVKGSKWIANNWIVGTTFEDRFKPSLFYTKP